MSFCCPLCGGLLQREGPSFFCENRHCFDRAKEGYLPLLPVQQKHSSDPGDDKAMVNSRELFLSRGYYAPLQQALISLVRTYGSDRSVLLDCGCGEGYYTNAIAQQVPLGECLGIDISKAAVKKAAKKSTGAQYAVASSFHLPVADASVDLLLNCFSPLCLEEFSRVLKPGGFFFYVVPGARHLWQMKEVLYEHPYENEEKLTPYEGYAYRDVQTVSGRIFLPSQEEISALFSMTPYVWKTGPEDVKKLQALSSLQTEISFHIHILQKEV